MHVYPSKTVGCATGSIGNSIASLVNKTPRLGTGPTTEGLSDSRQALLAQFSPLQASWREPPNPSQRDTLSNINSAPLQLKMVFSHPFSQRNYYANCASKVASIHIKNG